MTPTRLVKQGAAPPITPEAEAYVRELIRQEIGPIALFVAAAKRAVLQLATAVRGTPDP
jgi:hypothetical protein